MVELICLACGRTNPADAKFCSQCGAALLRRFCEQCRAVNDAAAHFCHACGAALSGQLLPNTVAPVPDHPPEEEARAPPPPGVPIPTLNEVLPTDDTGAATTAPTPQPLQVPAPEHVAAVSGDGVPHATRPVQRTALLTVGALIVLLLMAALWSRVPRTDVRPPEATTGSTENAASANVAAPPPAPSVATEPASTTTIDSSAPVEANAPDTRAGSKAAESGPEALPAPFEKPRAATPRRSVAAPNRPAPGTATPAPSPAPTPARECTREADALGLCAPGTTITGR